MRWRFAGREQLQAVAAKHGRTSLPRDRDWGCLSSPLLRLAQPLSDPPLPDLSGSLEDLLLIVGVQIGSDLSPMGC
jgi:hypothetical protein